MTRAELREKYNSDIVAICIATGADLSVGTEMFITCVAHQDEVKQGDPGFETYGGFYPGYRIHNETEKSVVMEDIKTLFE